MSLTHLQTDRKYEVIQAFTDFDGQVHPVGETFWFRGDNFLPYDDGLSLFLSPDGEKQIQVRMRWLPGDQGEILDRFREYVREAAASTG